MQEFRESLRLNSPDLSQQQQPVDDTPTYTQPVSTPAATPGPPPTMSTFNTFSASSQVT